MDETDLLLYFVCNKFKVPLVFRIHVPVLRVDVNQNHKFQITNLKQISMTKIQNSKHRYDLEGCFFAFYGKIFLPPRHQDTKEVSRLFRQNSFFVPLCLCGNNK